jgi:hypothetical protein
MTLSEQSGIRPIPRIGSLATTTFVGTRFQRRYAGAFPSSVDLPVEQRFSDALIETRSRTTNSPAVRRRPRAGRSANAALDPIHAWARNTGINTVSRKRRHRHPRRHQRRGQQEQRRINWSIQRPWPLQRQATMCKRKCRAQPRLRLRAVGRAVGSPGDADGGRMMRGRPSIPPQFSFPNRGGRR